VVSGRPECHHSGVRKTVLIVDDHAGFRSWARVFLESEGFHVVGEAADGESALAAARTLDPSIVLLDVQMPGEDGFDVARRLAAESHGGGTRAVVLTSSRPAADYEVQLTGAAGRIRGFIEKAELSGVALEHLIARGPRV
jgi:DNA-binding NarL/FixJ family response regulator